MSESIDRNRSIRVGAAGIIVQGGKVLLVKFDERGIRYNFPGGGHQEGETLRQTAAREVKEETDADVEVGRLLVTAESTPHKVANAYGSTHFLKFFFECKLKSGSVAKLPETPDPDEVAVEWLPIESLAQEPIIPNIAEALIRALNTGQTEFFEDDGNTARKFNKQ